jgi:hypothetical protein
MLMMSGCGSDIVEGVPADEYVGGVGGDADDPAVGLLQVRDGEPSWVHVAPEVDVLIDTETRRHIQFTKCRHTISKLWVRRCSYTMSVLKWFTSSTSSNWHTCQIEALFTR